MGSMRPASRIPSPGTAVATKLRLSEAHSADRADPMGSVDLVDQVDPALADQVDPAVVDREADPDSAEAVEVEEVAAEEAEVALGASAADAELRPMATPALAIGAALIAALCMARSSLRKATPP